MSDLIETAKWIERDRCAQIAENLAAVYDRVAANIRKSGTYTTRSIWPPFRVRTIIFTKWEAQAKEAEHVASNIRTCIVKPALAGNAPVKL